MIALRIRCTESELEAAYEVLGLRNPAAMTRAAAQLALQRSQLVDAAGTLQSDVAAILPIVAAPGRVIAVSSSGPDDAAPHLTTILAPRNGGPFVFRGDRDDEVDLVAVDSPTAATALIDEMLMITALPTAEPDAEITISPETWLGLLATADAVRAARLEAQLARAPDPVPEVDEMSIGRALEAAQQSRDPRWLLGATSAVHPDLVDVGTPSAPELLALLEAEGFAHRVADQHVVTADGLEWLNRLHSPLRVSHIRVVAMQGQDPADVGAITLVRSPVSIVLVSHGHERVTMTSRHPDVAAAMIRAMLVGAGDETAAIADAAPRASIAASDEATEWVYTLEAVSVLGLEDTSQIVGTMQPGAWYALIRQDGQWSHVAEPNGDASGWVPAANVRHRSDSAAPETPQTAPVVPVARWEPTHRTPAGGLAAWERPDPYGPTTATLREGTALQVIERNGAWAHVRATNGWEGWVDGRPLTDEAPPRPSPAATSQLAPPAAPAAPPPRTSPDAAQSRKLTIGATVAVFFAAILPWMGSEGSAADIPAAFLVTGEPYADGPSVGILLFALVAAAAATIAVENLQRFQAVVGSIAVAVAAAFIVQLFRLLIEDYDFPQAIGSLFTDSFGLAPWVLLAAGVVLIVKR